MDTYSHVTNKMKQNTVNVFESLVAKNNYYEFIFIGSKFVVIVYFFIIQISFSP
jgi:hypothetical protein